MWIYTPLDALLSSILAGLIESLVNMEIFFLYSNSFAKHLSEVVITYQRFTKVQTEMDLLFLCIFPEAGLGSGSTLVSIFPICLY